MVYNNLIKLCIEGNKNKIIEYISSDKIELSEIKDAFGYVMVNNMEKCFFDIIDYIVKKLDIYTKRFQMEYFEYACIGGNVKIISWFLSNGYNISNLIGCLNATTYNNNTNATKFLMSSGANTKEHINCDNCFAFLNAIKFNNEELIKLFIKYEVDIDLAINTINNEYKKKYQKNIIDKINYFVKKYSCTK